MAQAEQLRVGDETYSIYRLDTLQATWDVARLPYTLRILLENVLRNGSEAEVEAVAGWVATDEPSREISFAPARVLLQDFTGVPCVVDLAAMRDAMREHGGDPKRINPLIPAELVIDHSVQVDEFASRLAIERNVELEFHRNRERYAFLRWGQTAYDNFKVVPPNTGSCHQVNLEYLGRVVEARDGVAFPDTLVGTDSHTTMINGLGVLGWGVGGIEAEAAMLGEALSMLVPQVVGFKLSGELPQGATATDLVLTVTELLRKVGVDYTNGSPDRAVADTFPASDPTTEQQPGAEPERVPDLEPSHIAVLEKTSVPVAGEDYSLEHGSVVIAAITSCTNTSNPSVMIGAGLLAKKAVEKGLKRKPWVKSSLAPGSRAVTEYYRRSGLETYLDELGFNTVGYGCTTCIGNSGPLPEPISNAISEGDLVVCAVLSGNRNFEARIHGEVKANYLASPPLVVAYALAGRMDVDLLNEPLGEGDEGPVYLRDIWPSPAEIDQTITSSVDGEMYTSAYGEVYAGDERWRSLETPAGELFAWEPDSTYVRQPPYFEGMSREPGRVEDVTGARCLVMLGDSVTTDHISPAGAIRPDAPAGKYLLEHGVERRDFNSYGARRGNHEVMVRGTFANVRLRNQLVPGSEGTWTVHLPDGEEMTIYDAAMRYRDEGVPTIVIAGKEYGSGSSRDWAAKGPNLLGVRAVIAESYERIHRSNLLMMGVLPLQFLPGESRESLGLTGGEEFSVVGVENGDATEVTVRADEKELRARVRLDTPREREYFRHGGILRFVLRRLLA